MTSTETKDIKNDIKIVFFGTPEFSVESLRRLLDDGRDVAAVVTMPDKIAGRGHKLIQSDVKKFAVERGLRVLQPEKLKDPEFLAELKSIGADLFIVIAFRMLPREVWEMPPLGTFNLHASLLPKYRGAAPINRAIMNGENETGVTTFFLKHDIDTGDIIDRVTVEILDSDNAGTLHDKLMTVGADVVAATVARIADGTVESRPQPVGEFIAAPKIFKETCEIDWSLPAEKIHNHVRGLSPYPAAWSTLTDSKDASREAKIFTTALTGRPVPEGMAPGDCINENGHLLVAAGDSLLEVVELQAAGKRRMVADAFMRGCTPIRFISGDRQ